MSAAAIRDDYRATWKALPRRERRDLARSAARGERGVSRSEAALLLWWSREQLRLGWRVVLTQLASFAVLVVIALPLLERSLGQPPAAGFPGAAVGVVVAHVAMVVYRRRTLRRTAQVNGAVLSGGELVGPPNPAEAERLLNLVRKEGWLRGMRPER